MIDDQLAYLKHDLWLEDSFVTGLSLGAKQLSLNGEWVDQNRLETEGWHIWRSGQIIISGIERVEFSGHAMPVRDKDGELILGSPNLWTDKYGLNVELDGLRISLSGNQLSLRYELGDVIEPSRISVNPDTRP
jgi:hypothetical protein